MTPTHLLLFAGLAWFGTVLALAVRNIWRDRR
jgi:hypothetical protein